jgi:hypothetical protein
VSPVTDDLGALLRAVHPDAERATVSDPPPARTPLRIRRVRTRRDVTVGAR